MATDAVDIHRHARGIGLHATISGKKRGPMQDAIKQTYVGFDSAWADKKPGAVCAAVFVDKEPQSFCSPRLASFSEALAFIEELASPDGFTFVTLDQPTIVPNAGGQRPVENAAARLLGRLGGGVHSSNSNKQEFCDDAPIWKFLERLDAIENPEMARTANDGLYLAEVFPALALASFDQEFIESETLPRYNPTKRTFKQSDWMRVTDVAARQLDAFKLSYAARLCRRYSENERPRKEDQHMLDAMLCMLVGMHWRLRDRSRSVLLGDLERGYMITPASPDVRTLLEAAAKKAGTSAA